MAIVVIPIKIAEYDHEDEVGERVDYHDDEDHVDNNKYDDVDNHN